MKQQQQQQPHRQQTVGGMDGCELSLNVESIQNSVIHACKPTDLLPLYRLQGCEKAFAPFPIATLKYFVKEILALGNTSENKMQVLNDQFIR